jgi:ATP/maltotriose-dependent transcriptional regulator MalT
MSANPDLGVADPLAAGREALRRGEWEQARVHFEAKLEQGESAEALEALAMAAWWLDDADETIQSRERAYRGYRDRGDRAAAARMAIWLAWDYLSFRGEPAVANGWLQRAHSLLDGGPPVAEQGWLAIREGELAFVLDNDVAATRRHARRARAVGRSVGVGDLELSALALEGLALASEGRVADGIRRLDEASAAAVAGEMAELWAASRACCYLVTACERVRDFERASQWCQRMLEFAKRWRIPSLFAVCRAHYAAVLVWRGVWDEAEAELEAAMREFAHNRPGMGYEAIVRLAELRRRQGRRDEASALFREVEFHPYAQLGLAAVALDGDDPALAVELAERFLRRLGTENRLQRVAGLELLVRGLVALGELEEARRGLAEMQLLVGEVGTDLLRASALAAEGAVAAAAEDAENARFLLEDAVDLYGRNGAPFEAASTRIELAHVLRALGRHDAALKQARTAHEAMRAMRAAHEAERAAALVRELDSAEAAQAGSPLTPRELEVLRLVAQGLSNPEIAERLILSEHTVHRHLANLTSKLGLSSRAAAAGSSDLARSGHLPAPREVGHGGRCQGAAAAVDLPKARRGGRSRWHFRSATRRRTSRRRRRRARSGSTTGSGTRGRCCSRTRRTSPRCAPRSSATWRRSSPSSSAGT